MSDFIIVIKYFLHSFDTLTALDDLDSLPHPFLSLQITQNVDNVTVTINVADGVKDAASFVCEVTGYHVVEVTTMFLFEWGAIIF